MRDELEEIQKTVRRRSAAPTIASDEDEAEYTADDFIVEEDNVVIVSRDGWVKRQKEVKDLVDDAAARGRRGAGGARRQHARDRACSSRNFGVAYTARIIDVPASTGYGEPIQRLFKLKDGERVVAALSLDPRVAGDITREEGRRAVPPVHAVAVTSDGYSLRFSLEPFVEPSTRAGRRYARAGRGRRGRRRRDDRPASEIADRRDARGARACCARPTRSTSCPARAAA